MSQPTMRVIDPGDIDAREAYQLVIGSIVPRPIGLVATLSERGVANVSPFSFFNAVSSKPPIVSVSIARGKHGEKDTMRNIRWARDFTVNVVDRPLAMAAVATSAPHEPHVSEFKVAGLTPIPSDKVKAPRVAESPIHLECVVSDLIESPGGSEVTLVLGRVLRFHVAQRLYVGETISPAVLDPLARLGGELYAFLGEPFKLSR